MSKQEYPYGESDENLKDSEYSKKSEFSKPLLVQAAVTKVLEARSKEMRAGYNNYTSDGKKIYVEDTRKVFMGSVDALKQLLSPEIKRNSNMKEVIKEFEEFIEEAFNIHSVHKMVCNDGHNILALKTKYIPELDEYIPVYVIEPNYGSPKRVVQYRKGIYNYATKKYWDDMLKAYDYLFGELNNLVDELEYFKPGGGY